MAATAHLALARAPHTCYEVCSTHMARCLCRLKCVMCSRVVHLALVHHERVQLRVAPRQRPHVRPRGKQVLHRAAKGRVGAEAQRVHLHRGGCVHARMCDAACCLCARALCVCVVCLCARRACLRTHMRVCWCVGVPNPAGYRICSPRLPSPALSLQRRSGAPTFHAHVWRRPSAGKRARPLSPFNASLLAGAKPPRHNHHACATTWAQ